MQATRVQYYTLLRELVLDAATNLGHFRLRRFQEPRRGVRHFDTVSGYAVYRVSSSSSHRRCGVPYSKSPVSLFSSALCCFLGAGRTRLASAEVLRRSVCRDCLLGEVRSIEVVAAGRQRVGDAGEKRFGGNVIGEDNGNGASSVWCNMASAGSEDMEVGSVSDIRRSKTR
jgi:hypothetical protein